MVCFETASGTRIRTTADPKQHGLDRLDLAMLLNADGEQEKALVTWVLIPIRSKKNTRDIPMSCAPHRTNKTPTVLAKHRSGRSLWSRSKPVSKSQSFCCPRCWKHIQHVGQTLGSLHGRRFLLKASIRSIGVKFLLRSLSFEAGLDEGIEEVDRFKIRIPVERC